MGLEPINHDHVCDDNLKLQATMTNLSNQITQMQKTLNTLNEMANKLRDIYKIACITDEKTTVICRNIAELLQMIN